MLIEKTTLRIGEREVLDKVIAKAPFRMGFELKDTVCFVYMKQGDTVYSTTKDEQIVGVGEGAVLKGGRYFSEWRKTAGSSECIVYAVHLYPAIIKEIYNKEIPSVFDKRTIPIDIQKVEADRAISDYIKDLDSYFDNPNLVNDHLLKSKVRNLIMVLTQTGNAELLIQLIAETLNPSLVALKTVVAKHIYSPISVEKMAELSGMSLSTFKRKFKEVYNETPKQYTNGQRLLKAKSLLNGTKMSVSDIAYKVGFEDPAYFSRIFKKQFKVSPRAFQG